MPIYNFKCIKCEKHFDRIMKFSEMNDPVDCPECKAPTKRMLTTFGHYTEIRNNGASVRPRGISKGGKRHD